MFVKPETGLQKLLDKKPLRITAYGDSKGLMLFKKFRLGQNRQGGRFPAIPCPYGVWGYFPASSFSLYITSLG